MAFLLVSRFARVTLKAGDIIECRADGAVITDNERTKFVIIDVPTAVKADLLPYTVRWIKRLIFNELQHVVPADRYRHELLIENASVSGSGNLERNDIEDFLNPYGIAVTAAAPNNVQVQFTIFGVASSVGFWRTHGGFKETYIFNEQNYESGTGEHTIEMDYSDDATINPNHIESNIAKFATVESHQNRVIVFTINRQTVLDEMFREIEASQEDPVIGQKFQYRISGGDLNDIIAAGGEVTKTLAEALAMIINKADE